MNVGYYISAVFVSACVLSVSLPIRSYSGVSSPSNASVSDLHDSGGSDFLVDSNVSYDEGMLKEVLDHVVSLSDRLSTPSDALEDQKDQEELSEEVDQVVEISDYGIDSLAVHPLPDHDVVNIKGRFDGVVYTLVVPRAYYPDLWVSDAGILYNLSSANITCRMFTGTTFNDSDYNYNLLTLTPMLGNSANNLYRYGSLSYRAYYYHSSGSGLTSTTTYGNFYVDDIQVQRSLDVDYRILYVLLAVLFMEGLVVLCLWKNSRLL